MNQSMARTVFSIYVMVLLLALPVRAQRWWHAPKLKAQIEFPNPNPGNGPHYWNQDKSGTFLFATKGYTRGGNDGAYLYSIDALAAANGVTTDLKPIAGVDNGIQVAPHSYGFRGGAISTELGLVLSGNAYAGPDGAWHCHACLPTDGTPWTRDDSEEPEEITTVFAISNNVSAHVVWDSGDFSHDSQYLYTNDYMWDIIPGESERIWKWEVGNLKQDGMGLISNAVYYTQVLGIWSINVYHIGGRDLIYYGGLNHTKERIIVCVFDTVDETETVLINLPNNAENNPDFDQEKDFEFLQNIKVGGIGRAQMHLYTAYDDGTIMVYHLEANGKKVNTKVRHFTPKNVMDILGVTTLSNCRAFEVTNDESVAFFSSHGQQYVHVFHSSPAPTMMLLRRP